MYPQPAFPHKHTPFCAVWCKYIMVSFFRAKSIIEASLSRTLCAKAWAEFDSWGPEHSSKAQTQPGSSNFTAWAPLWQSCHLPKAHFGQQNPSEGSLGKHVVNWRPGDIQTGIYSIREGVSLSLSVLFWWGEVQIHLFALLSVWDWWGRGGMESLRDAE